MNSKSFVLAFVWATCPAVVATVGKDFTSIMAGNTPVVPPKVEVPKSFEARASEQDKAGAVCYAQRYAALFQGFCQGVASKCPVEDLIDHYNRFGNEQGLIWGCIPQLEENAMCYAKRYPDLLQAFCNDDASQCDVLALYKHYQDTGSQSNLLWPCRGDFSKSSASKFQDKTASSTVAYPKITKIHVLIFETSDVDSAEIPLSAQMADNRISSWLSFSVIGKGRGFKGYGSKWVFIREFLRSHWYGNDTLIIVADARDTILNVPMSSFAESLLESVSRKVGMMTKGNRDTVIMSAESQCCVAALTLAHPGAFFKNDGSRGERACASGEDGCQWNGDAQKVDWEDAMAQLAYPSEAKDIYLNAGVVTGFAGGLTNLLELADIHETEDDQAVFTDLMLSFPNRIVLDYEQELFGTARWTKAIDNGGCPFQKSIFGETFYHQETKTTPLVIHTPGKYWECYDLVRAEAGLPQIKRAESLMERNRHRALQYTTPTIDDETECSGIFKIFCIIGKIFGDIAGFFAWLIDILTFGVFS